MLNQAIKHTLNRAETIRYEQGVAETIIFQQGMRRRGRKNAKSVIFIVVLPFCIWQGFVSKAIKGLKGSIQFHQILVRASGQVEEKITRFSKNSNLTKFFYAKTNSKLPFLAKYNVVTNCAFLRRRFVVERAFCF